MSQRLRCSVYPEQTEADGGVLRPPDDCRPANRARRRQFSRAVRSRGSVLPRPWRRSTPPPPPLCILHSRALKSDHRPLPHPFGFGCHLSRRPHRSEPPGRPLTGLQPPRNRADRGVPACRRVLPGLHESQSWPQVGWQDGAAPWGLRQVLCGGGSGQRGLSARLALYAVRGIPWTRWVGGWGQSHSTGSSCRQADNPGLLSCNAIPSPQTRSRVYITLGPRRIATQSRS